MKNKTLDGPAKANGLSVLLGLNNTGKHIYGGTVPYAEVQRRRSRNRMARRTRASQR